MKREISLLIPLLVLLSGSASLAAPRDVQLRTVDTQRAIVELHNYGATDVDLSGWRFCTQDDNETLRYSGLGGFNGITIEAGTSIFIHYNDDAPVSPDAIDRSTLGGFFALPLDNGPYALSIYFPPVVFGDGNTMADHVQWSVGGIDDIIADERSDEAQTGGLWTNQSLWVSTAVTTRILRLNPGAEASVNHAPGDYTAFAGAPPRDLMLRGVDFDTGIVELHNFSTQPADLAGWRFCTQDDNETLRYSGLAGLDGVTVEAGTSIFVHYNDDAPTDPDAINRSALGGFFALPLDTGPYALSIYFPPIVFGNGNTMADHVQWSVNGVDNGIADERSDEAQAGGLWDNQSSWVSTEAGSAAIELVDGAEFRVLHDQLDYAVTAGTVSGGRVPATLTVEKSAGQLLLSWGSSCAAGDDDFGIYQGTLGGIFDSHTSILCSTAGATQRLIDSPAGSSYFLVVPNDGSVEGSYGTDSDGLERNTGGNACAAQSLGCP